MISLLLDNDGDGGSKIRPAAILANELPVPKAIPSAMVRNKDGCA
jgi:hypothetical protein